MRKSGLIVVSIVVLAFCGLAVAKHFWRGKTMSVPAVEKTWGHDPFDACRFREGDAKTRSKMAKSMMSSKQFIGKSSEEIRKELGSWDGYYFPDMFPAYIIQDGRIEKGDTWQIVFLLDQHQKVTEVIVHKNCCE